MNLLKLAAAVSSTLALVIAGASSAEAAWITHKTIVNGFEFHATSTQGSFAGAASGVDRDGLSGAWAIVVDHTWLESDRCGHPSHPCAQVTGGSFSLGVTSPSAEFVTGNFNYQRPGTDGIVMVNGGSNCTTQLFHITDGLNSVGTGSQHPGWGTFDAYLWHYRHWLFGQCVTYSATVKGNVSLTY